MKFREVFNVRKMETPKKVGDGAPTLTKNMSNKKLKSIFVDRTRKEWRKEGEKL